MNVPQCTQCSRPLPPDAPDELCPYCLLAFGETQASDDARPRSRFEAPDLTELQQHFDHHQLEILKLIGSGGMGAVYHARQTHLMRDVALKILPPELAASLGFDERFTREARVLAKLDHANVIDVYDFGIAGPYSYLMMEYVDGVNLRDLILGGEMNAQDAFEIIPQLCDALQYAHDQGIVHRDIKPENILVDQTGRVCITDFGLAKLAHPDADDLRLTGTHQIMGTPSYMAPEQIEKPRQVDHRADIYALGVVFYELLTGELPLGRFDPPSSKGTGPKRLDKVVMKTLEKEPERRYDHASDVKDDVERVVGSDASASRTAKQAADFVVDSANSAQASIAALASDQAIFRKLGFATAIVCFYMCLLIVILAIAELPVLSILFALGAVILAAVAAALRVPTSNAVTTWAAQPPLWVADRVDTLISRRRKDWAGASRSAIAALICVSVFLISTLFLVLFVGEADFFWPAVFTIVGGFILSRRSFRKYPEATRRERWCYLPSILLLQTAILIPLLLGPSTVVAALLVEQNRDVQEFVTHVSGQSSQARAGLFTLDLILLSFFGWMSFLAVVSYFSKPVIRWLAFPFLKKWDGEWLSIIAVTAILMSVVFMIGAISIANG